MSGARARRLVVGLLALALGAGQAAAQVDTGSADFTRFVALGDSLLAGFADGGLVEDRQLDSIPALIHRQAVGDGTFEQPLIGEPGIPPLLELVGLLPPEIDRRPGLGEPLNAGLPRPYDNLAVPGARVRDTVARETDIEEEGDPPGMHDLILRGMGTALEQAAALEPTFVAVWIGSNDTLGAALSGTVVDGVTLTPVDEFREDYRVILDELRAANETVRFALATLPDVTRIPFVTAVPPFLVDPLTGEPVLVGGQRVFLLGPDGPLSDADRVLLSATPLLAAGIGVPAALGGTGEPLPPDVVLTAEEIELIRERTEALNNVIFGEAAGRRAAFVDVGAVFDGIAEEGLSVAGIRFTTEFLLGGIVSLDGVHPTRFGSAFVANLFLESINQRFGARIPLVNLHPFVFGQLAETAGVPPEAVPASRLSAAALEGLFGALRVPSVGPGEAPAPPPAPAPGPDRARPGDERGRLGPPPPR